MEMTRMEYVNTQWPDCRSFAREVLGLHVDARGRVKSPHQSEVNNNALVLERDKWFDFSIDIGGYGVLSLCQWMMFDGDKGKAMKYLAGDFFSVDEREWLAEIEKITGQCKRWHEKLTPEDREYLHSRRITDETIERLQLGSIYRMWDEHKIPVGISIPYFKDGRIVYYIIRDRSGAEGQPKYKKCTLPKETKYDKDGKPYYVDKEVLENTAWGWHTLHRDHKQAEITTYGINKLDWLIITEGMFDGMSFEQEGWQVLCSGGGHFTKTTTRAVLAEARDYKNVLLIYDNDDKGKGFQAKLSQEMFRAKVHFMCGQVPSEFEGKPIKDVSDFYTAGGDLAELVMNAQEGIEVLADTMTDTEEMKNFVYKYARYADKADVVDLIMRINKRKCFNPFWLNTLMKQALGTPAETIIMDEIMKAHNLKYIEGDGFYEYEHGVWLKRSDNRIKSYADEKLGRYATNTKITAIMKFLKARLSCEDEMNATPIINLRNGILQPNDACKFVMHDPSNLSTIQIPYNYDRMANCILWRKFIRDICQDDMDKGLLLQEMAGYILWPNNNLEKCFFLIGDGGNGKGVFMETLRDVFGRANCSALTLSSFGHQFDTIMLQHSLVNFASETRIDLRGNIERIKEVTSGNDITAAHKGIDAIKFAPRCKLITSCNDFFNTGDITQSVLRRMVFVKFTRNVEQLGQADPFLKDRLHEELPGILNWCIQGYLRLLQRATERQPGQPIFTPTQEDTEQKREFMRTTNPVAFFTEETFMQTFGEQYYMRDIYKEFKTWAEDAGYKTQNLGAFTRKFQQSLTELRPDARVVNVNDSVKKIVIFPDKK